MLRSESTQINEVLTSSKNSLIRSTVGLSFHAFWELGLIDLSQFPFSCQKVFQYILCSFFFPFSSFFLIVLLKTQRVEITVFEKETHMSNCYNKCVSSNPFSFVLHCYSFCFSIILFLKDLKQLLLAIRMARLPVNYYIIIYIIDN